jgi:hypothetical protein
MFLFLTSNIPLLPVYGVLISQLRYARACFANENFSKLGQLPANKLMLLGDNKFRLKSPFHKLYGCLMALFAITNDH